MHCREFLKFSSSIRVEICALSNDTVVFLFFRCLCTIASKVVYAILSYDRHLTLDSFFNMCTSKAVSPRNRKLLKLLA